MTTSFIQFLKCFNYNGEYQLDDRLDWYADYSTLPDEMCFRYIVDVQNIYSQSLYQVWLDVKNENTLLPYDLTVNNIKLYLVNKTHKLYDFIFLNYYNGTDLPKIFSVKGAMENSSLGWSVQEYMYSTSNLFEKWFPIVKDISEAPQEFLTALNNE